MNPTRIVHAGSIRARRYKNAMESDSRPREEPSIIEALVLLPTQSEHRRALYDSPEAELWLAVGIQSVHDFLELKPHLRPEQRKAEDWIFSEGTELRSFRWLCDLFEVDVDASRERLRYVRALMIERRRAGRYLRSA